MKFFVRLGSVCAAAFLVTACAVATAPDDDLFSEAGGGGDGSGGGDGGSCTSKCNGMCVDLRTDNANCGVCGKACPGDAKCVAGSCQCPTGDGGASQSICNGACVDTKSDVNNCGSCGLKCGAEGGTPMGGGIWICNNGSCDISCTMPKSPCVPYGCFDLTSDNTNCGSCGNDCSGALCLMGNCCNQGEINCNGACTDTNTDGMNCGMCGNKCASNKCTMGKCCSTPPTGKCAHALCTSGVNLANNCDGVGCVSKICTNDPYCCQSSWDSICVGEVDTYCSPTYSCKC